VRLETIRLISIEEREICIESQKKIIIGKNGSMLKEIGIQARKEIEKLLGARVFLEIFIKVKTGWSSNVATLKDMGIE